ncbi:MAG: hypothetical protein WC974_02935 [Thermoplasmata archaeon]
MMTIAISHQHDWWYFWLVYDMVNHKPTKVYYDFHHIRYEKNWIDLTVRPIVSILRDELHPQVWVDAGGHRSLYAPGKDNALLDTVSWWRNKDNSRGVLRTEETEIYKSGMRTGWKSTDPNTDEGFGVMIDGLGLLRTVASWRATRNADISGSIASMIVGWLGPDVDVAEFTGWRGERTTLKAEDFKKVYIWDTTSDATPRMETEYDSPAEDGILNQWFVYVGFSGDNSYIGTHPTWWPSTDSSSSPTYLPWLTDDHKSTVYEAWVWQEYEKSKSTTRDWEWAPMGAYK